VIIRRLHPEPFKEIDADTDDGQSALSAFYAPRRKRWLRVNLIASVNGAAAGADGTSESLTNRVDRRILGTIRRRADIVLVGAASVRTEGYFLPKTAPLAIITGSGDLTGHRIPRDVPAGKVLVLCPSTAAATVRDTLDAENVSILELGTSDGHAKLNPAEAIQALRALGNDSIVCEGGPNLAGQLLNADLVDELCLSTSPQLSATVLPVLPGLTVNHSLHLEQLLSDSDGHLFARWTVST
jgi:riboflavin biosynthesis pyrimidine reductase